MSLSLHFKPRLEALEDRTALSEYHLLDVQLRLDLPFLTFLPTEHVDLLYHGPADPGPPAWLNFSSPSSPSPSPGFSPTIPGIPLPGGGQLTP
jgi:hypothetical protein